MKLGNLLIIDDEELLVKNVAYLLSKYAENIFTGNNGHEGLAIIEKEDIHCVICDIAMPKMNGVELIKQVREKGIEVPFIFYTAYGHNELMMEAAKYGAYDFLKKPDFEGLDEVVVRGLKEGFKRSNNSDIEQDKLSEYDKIFDAIKKL